MKIRYATPADKADILVLLVRMYMRAGMGRLNPDKVSTQIDSLLNNGLILLVETNTGERVGAMGLQINSLWWCDDAAIMDMFTYIAPEARQSRAFRLLFTEASSIAAALSLPLLLANFGPVDETRKSKLFRRLGRPLGSTIIAGHVSGFFH